MAHNPRLSYCWRDVGATDNLAELSKLDENRILIELKARYLNDEIYTYVGDILIAVNPLKDLHIYGKKTALAYKNAKLSEQPPHIYATASHVYKCMLGVEYDADPHSQCIVISGESGAGKTESTKLVVKQIIELCNGNTQLEQQILQVNPLLEAFGNAKTVINENSSRFGKYIQLLFHSGKVVGAKISEYLLEKSRVVHQNAGDANFHIFNYMFAGCSEEQRQTFKLGSRENYRYTKSCDQTADATFYQNKFEQLQNAMDLVGFSEEEQDDLLAVLSGVLSVGNVDFADKVSSERVGVSQVDDLAAAAHLFGVKPADLQECLTRLTNSTRGEQIIINFSRTQAEDARDAVAKVIYGRLFSWIVNKINQRLSPDQRSIDQLEIGILDIFGFENFASNSFEQACINLANEHLQYFFNEHIFSLEQEEYKSEGIKWSHISYSDNQPLLDLFLKKMGILALLDEESHFPQGTDASFVDKLNKNLSSHECYKKQRAARTPRFAIQHYAGHVTYDVKNWLEKNRDTIPPSLMSMLKQSSNLLLRTIFKGNITRTGTLALQNRTRKSVTAKQPIRPSTSAPSNSKKLTVGTQFKNSLQELIRQMSKANPHFIRCLKPNASRLAGEFDDKYILSQLSYTGMLQTVQIRRDGYAFRPLIPDFICTYKPLILHSDVPIDGETCKQILRKANLTNWHIGKTKVFLKHHHAEVLAKDLSAVIGATVTLQAVARGFLARKYVHRLRKVSEQHKVYVKSFLLGVQTNSEMFLTNQTVVIQHEIKERERKAGEKRAEAAAEAERKHAESLVTQQLNSAPRNSVPADSDKPARPVKPQRLSMYSVSSVSVEPNISPIPRVRRPSRSVQDPLPVLPLPPSPSPLPPAVRSPTESKPQLRHNHTASLRNIYSDNRCQSFVERFSQLGYNGMAEDDEFIEDDYSIAHRAETVSNLYGPVGAKNTTVKWFQTSQLQKLLEPFSERPYEWFHGIIPRAKAEKMLLLKPVGAFMIRLSEKRLGYVLTFRAETRCRHYMVDPTPSNKYVVVGEPKVHKTLEDLVKYHQKLPLSNWNHLLTEPCGQQDVARPDYAELWTSGHPTPPTQPLSASYMDMKGRQPPLQQVTANSTKSSTISTSNVATHNTQDFIPPLPPKTRTKTRPPVNYISYK